MKCTLVVAVIALFVSDGTTVNAHRFGDPEFHQGFHEHGSMSDVQIGIFSGHPAYRFFGLCSHSHLHKHRPLPDFLKNVTAEGLNEFCDAVKNENLTKAELEQRLNEWAQKQGGDVEIEFNKFVEEKKQKRNNIKQKAQQLIVNVTQFINEMETIHGDMSLTRRQEKEKVLDLVKRTDRAVLAVAMKIRAEIGFILGEHGHGPCPGCRPWFPHLPPPFPHHRPHFGPRMFRNAPQFPGDDGGQFGEEGPFGRNGPFGANGNPPQGGPFGPNGNLWQDGPFGPSGNSLQGGNFGRNTPFERNGPFEGHNQRSFESDPEWEEPEIAVDGM